MYATNVKLAFAYIYASGMGTNLYGRFYCPGRPLDMGVREEIIRLFQQNMKVNQISKILKISHGCVSKIIKRSVKFTRSILIC